MLVYDDTALQEKIRIYDKGVDVQRYYDTFGDFQFSYRYGDIQIPRIEEAEPLKAECEHFADCIRTASFAAYRWAFRRACGERAARREPFAEKRREQNPDRNRSGVKRMSGDIQMPRFACVADDVRLGARVRLSPFVNLYGCEIGEETRLGAFVEVQRDATIGQRCKISSHTFICSGVTIEDEVFVGHGVVFINDRNPRATTADGAPQTESDWRMEGTVVRRGASIGSGSVILCGVEIGARAMVGAGAVVTRDVPPDAVVAGNPARVRRPTTSDGETINPNNGASNAD